MNKNLYKRTLRERGKHVKHPDLVVSFNDYIYFFETRQAEP